MKSLLAFAAVVTMITGLAYAPAKADLAGWAEAQARAQVASQLVADNMHRMR